MPYTTILKLKLISVALFLAALIFEDASLALGQKIEHEVNVEDLHPLKHHTKAVKLVSQYIQEKHYLPREIDDQFSEQLLEQYLKTLDPTRSFFTKTSLEHIYKQYRHTLDDLIKRGDITPAYEIFKIYRKNLIKQLHYAEQTLIPKIADMQFTQQETYFYDRSEASWEDNDQALNTLWEKRIKHEVLSLLLAEKNQEEVKKILSDRYTRIYNITLQLNRDDVFDRFINAYTAIFDPHTSYFSPSAKENFDIGMRLSLEGIGAVLTTSGEHTQVTRIISGGPADIDGRLYPDDIIVGVSKGANINEIVNIVGWRLEDVIKMIRGPKGSVVHLSIIPGGKVGAAATTISLSRNKVDLKKQEAKGYLYHLETNDLKIGVIEIPTFYADIEAKIHGEADYRSVSHDVKLLLSEMREEKINGLLIDLRGNLGGSLAETITLSGFFLREGAVVQVKNKKGAISIGEDVNPSIAYNGPLAVLVDRNSASASEIFAAAIQDYQRGIIIGERTFGKGTVQNIMSITPIGFSKKEIGSIKVTTAKFFRVNGETTQLQGVKPDILFPGNLDDNESGERKQNNPLLPETIKAIQITKLQAPIHLNPIVQNRLDKRFIETPVLKAILHEQKLAKNLISNKQISLQKEQRKKSMQAITDSEEKIVTLFENIKTNRIALQKTEESEEKKSRSYEKKKNSIEAMKASLSKKIQEHYQFEAAKILGEYIEIANNKAVHKKVASK